MAARVAWAPSQLVRLMLRFRLVCARAHWEHWALNLIVNGGALSLMRHGVWATLGVNATGHHILSVVERGKGPPRLDRRPNLAASYFEWSSSEKRQDLFDGRLRRIGIRRSWMARFFVSRPPKNFRLVRQ